MRPPTAEGKKTGADRFPRESAPMRQAAMFRPQHHRMYPRRLRTGNDGTDSSFLPPCSGLGGRTPRTSTAAPTGSIRYRPRRECERIGSGARMTPFCEDGNRDFEHCELRSFNASPTIAAQHSARKPDWRSFSGLRPARREGGKDRRLFLQSAARSPNGCDRKPRRPAHRLQRGYSTRDRPRCPDTCRRA